MRKPGRRLVDRTPGTQDTGRLAGGSIMDWQRTYRELHDRVLRLAGVLRDHGVCRGDGWPTSGPITRHSWKPCSRRGVLGAVFVPLNTRLAAPEIAYNLTTRQCRAGPRARTRRCGREDP